MNFCKAVGEESHMDEWARNIYVFSKNPREAYMNYRAVWLDQKRHASPNVGIVAHMMEQT
jgi:hypothetical protein